MTAVSILAYNILRAINLIGPFDLRARLSLTKKEAPTNWSLSFPHGLFGSPFFNRPAGLAASAELCAASHLAAPVRARSWGG